LAKDSRLVQSSSSIFLEAGISRNKTLIRKDLSSMYVMTMTRIFELLASIGCPKLHCKEQPRKE
jgi:hypothetical protein